MNYLKIVREKQCFTKRDLANAVGVTERYISFIEQGKRTPSLEIAGKIARVLDNSVDNIFLPVKCTKSTLKDKEKSA
ncbi:helix-turn-helix transcriptional regulator [Pectinatus frisingensis]|uniref:helix-turn-helix transcriptional regulator n=1 Tax=Pectinatus frisingensis TaxID=865 RepID=UPI003D804E79